MCVSKRNSTKSVGDANSLAVSNIQTWRVEDYEKRLFAFGVYLWAGWACRGRVGVKMLSMMKIATSSI